MKKSFISRLARPFTKFIVTAVLAASLIVPQSAGAVRMSLSSSGFGIFSHADAQTNFGVSGRLQQGRIGQRFGGLLVRMPVQHTDPSGNDNTPPVPPAGPNNPPSGDPGEPNDPTPPPSNPSGPSKGFITLTFDDGYESIYQEAVPRLNAAGLKGTFYITTGFLGEAPYMSETQVKAIYQSGHEIAAHSRTHPHYTELSEQQKRDETLGSKQDLEALGIGGIASFAYPFGEFDDETVAIVKEAGFSSARTAGGGINMPTADPYLLEVRNLNQSVTMGQVKEWIDQARDTETWQVFALHRIEDNTSDFYNTEPEMLQEIIDYLKQQNIQVVTVTGGVNSFLN